MIASRRVFRRAVVALFAVCAVCAVVATDAVAGEPTGDFAIFKQCPTGTSGVNLCIYSETYHGEATIGRRTIPLEKKSTMQGGIIKDVEVHPNTETFVGAANGETLSKVPQKVPGGLFGMPLYVTLELVPAGEVEISPKHLLSGIGTGVALPVRMRLENPLLGGECYLGSRSNPIVLHLTTGTTSPNPPNKPISGEVGELALGDEENLSELPGTVLVDNTFSIPGATGCGGPGDASLVDSMIDNDLGLPSPDGYNTIVQDNTFWEGTAERVIASEGK